MFRVSRRYIASNADAYLIIKIGQSNCVGYAESARLANTQFNYEGILAGYPTVRTSQPQYSTTPSGVYIFNKGTNVNSDAGIVSNGVWEAYNASVNTTSTAGGAVTYGFGHELSLATKIHAQTGKDVYIINACSGGTRLNGLGYTSTPWANFENIAIGYINEYWIKEGIEKLRIFAPNKKIKLLSIDWIQGEADASTGVTKSQYKASFYNFKQRIDTQLKKYLSIDTYYWFLFELSFARDSAEGVINSALSDIAVETSDCRYLTGIYSFPNKTQLTTVEASPITKGSPNSQAGLDDNHWSYIKQLAAGELAYDKIVFLNIL